MKLLRNKSVNTVEIKILSSNKIKAGIECFASAIARDWPNSKKEAKNWIDDEFHNPDSIVFGAFIKNKLIGVCSLVSFNFVLKKMDLWESKLVINTLINKLGVNAEEMIYMGGFGVKENLEGKGIGTKLFNYAEEIAKNNGLKVLVGHTAGPSRKYDKIKGLSFALSLGMKKLGLGKTICLSSPRDLEKVWLYKII